MGKKYIDPTFHLKKSQYEDETAPYREYRHKWSENPANYIVEKFPIHIDLETITACNSKCFMCFQSYDTPAPSKMDIGIFKKCIDEGVQKGLCSIKTQYRGEPLLDNRMAKMVKYAKEKGVIEVFFNTNASLLNREKAEELIKAGLDKIICSIDGCTKEVYESVRSGLKFDTILENIKNIQKIKKERGLKKPIVRVQMVDTPKNHGEIDEYMEFWGKIADQVAMEDMLDWNIEVDDSTPLPDFACAQLWQRLMILSDCDVLPCCRAMRGGNEKLEVLGNVKEDSLSEIWKGRKLNRLRELHKNGESHKIRMCRLCGIRKLIAKSKKIR